MSRRGWIFAGLAVALGGGAYVVYSFVASEVHNSHLQARLIGSLGQRLTFEILPGASDSIRFPHSGPYDARMGYGQVPLFAQRLEQRGYVPAEQARMSPEMVRLIDEGLFTPYREKNQAGLLLRDCNGLTLAFERYPQRQYPDFGTVPPLLVSALLYVENQGLLNPEYPNMNPALDWRRLSRAVLDQVIRLADKSHDAPGGSTLATQIEKYRHSPEGRTASIPEKFRQMASASLRAYLDGPDTQRARERIVVDYLNTVPLSARAGFGEINGIGDGLWVWYGEDFGEVNRLLKELDQHAPEPRQAQAFKRALSLIISQRRPSYHLRRDDTNLDALTGSYLRLLAANNVITAELRDVALAQPLDKAAPPQSPPQEPFVTRKAVNRVRADITRLTGVESRYDMDRLDLTVDSTVNREAQRIVTETLQRVNNKADARAMGLYGHNLLRDHDDPSKLMTSFTLYERVGNASVVRIQADNIDQPFDINSGARLNLGSTAKLRTLVTYLEIISELHARYAGMTSAQLAAVPLARQDALSHWAVDYLLKARKPAERELMAMLDAAMERKYSGGAGEAFYTGGGLQSFSNFERESGMRNLTVRTAFQHSVNLVFIRMMRDIVRYETFHASPDIGELFDDRDAPGRRAYLERFADQEGSAYMTNFYQRYRGKSSELRLATLLGRVRMTTPHLNAVRMSVTLLSARPHLDEDSYIRIMRARLGDKQLAGEDLSALYRKYGKDKFNLNDRGYLSRVHPLELWMVEYLDQHPDATLAEILKASTAERQEVYKWLFRTRSKAGQDNRIRTLLEQDAFTRIARRWQRLGYPFDSLTPSYGSAIGAAGDRPAALAELAGILLAGGVVTQNTAVRSLAFADGTPYATRYVLQPGPGKRVLPAEVAELARRSMLDVVERGTARSIRGAFTVPGRDGATLAVAGKTGTGDQRYQVYGPGGRLISSRSVNRSATFVFTLGERFFGTVVVNVREPYAARYSFTSALAVRVLRAVAPQVSAMAPGGDRPLLRCHDAAPGLRTPRVPAMTTPADAVPGATLAQGLQSLQGPARSGTPNTAAVPQAPAAPEVPALADAQDAAGVRRASQPLRRTMP
ncbi:transglycosylase domain-containing protein [Cupriavidus necator]|uniref:transglycosylase domain-containing protein n=1 Tax=Cupriavidus necator TaxID=106590 RepID=UPI0007890C5C|nr:transglycosylase domain-containing protein [Cupriavidus necator]